MVSIDYLNMIAQNQELYSPLGKYLFNLETDDELDAFIDKLYSVLCTQGFNGRVASSVIELFPLALENIAISKYISETNSIGLRNAMPEILSAEEALIYAIGDSYEIGCSDVLQAQFIYLFNQLVEAQNFLIGNQE
jgi:hypothetical protein